MYEYRRIEPKGVVSADLDPWALDLALFGIDAEVDMSLDAVHHRALLMVSPKFWIAVRVCLATKATVSRLGLPWVVATGGCR